jgi:CRISPR-associated protein Cmr1
LAEQKLEIKLKTLTPLWTGGVEAGKMDRLHETGIIGSLRWWYEAIVRGLGGDVCDPTSDNPQHRCQFDTDAYHAALRDGQKKSIAVQAGLRNVCPVCRLFGCTGWKRRFELSALMESDQLTGFWLATRDQPGKFNHWWLSQVFRTTDNRVYYGDLSLQVHFMRGYETHQDTLKALLSFVAVYGAIGARTQYGFGQFAYPDANSIDRSLTLIRQQFTGPAEPKNLSDNFYSLQNFWHLQCRIPETDRGLKQFNKVNIVGDRRAFQRHGNRCLSVSFDIRYKLPGNQDAGLRQAYRLARGKATARQIFGTVENEDRKSGSRVFVSHLYKTDVQDSHYWLSVWGFTQPEVNPDVQFALRAIFPEISITVTTGQDILGAERNVS